MTDEVNVFIEAFERRLTRNDVVVQAARLLSPSLFERVQLNGFTEEQVKTYLVQRRYEISTTLYKAEILLRFAAQHENLREELIEDEVHGWLDLGIPTIHEPLIRQIAEKKLR